MTTEQRTVPLSDRGFAQFGTIADERGASVKVIEASACPLGRLWLFLDESEKAGGASVMLTVEKARDLRDTLDMAIEYLSERYGAGAER